MRELIEGKNLDIQPECFPCFLRQAVIALDFAGAERSLKAEVLMAVLDDIRAADLEKSPAHATTAMHRRIRRMLNADPFGNVKSAYNKLALGLYPELKKTVADSPDPLNTAARLAIAGNVIDFGIFSSVDIEGTVKRALGEPLAVDRFEYFRRAVMETREVLYLLDNAGEVAFDRILIEELAGLGKHVTAVAKGSPIINDCTAADALETGLAGACDIIDNGSDCVGTIVESTPEDFRERLAADGVLVISKGQGNFETLAGHDGNIFFLFQSKCEVVSRFLGLPAGAMVLAGRG